MGMFDYVKFRSKCFNCKYELGRPEKGSEFQSKDGDCTLSVLKPKDVRRFYEICPKCKAWNEYKVRRGKPILDTEASHI